MFNFLKNLTSRSLLKKSFFKLGTNLSDLNISVNESPLSNSHTTKYVAHFPGEAWGVEYIVNTNKNENKIKCQYTISKNKLAKNYIEKSSPKKSIATSLEFKKNEFIALQILNFQEGLKKITPQNNIGEEKVVEWLKVSLEVLKKALLTVNHDDLILQYKLYFNSNHIRLIIYNLDIELINFNNKIIFKAFNYKNNKEKFKDPIYNVELKYSYNDIFNQFITVLNQIKESEKKLFSL